MPRYKKPLFVAGGTITVTEPDFVESCVDVAVMVTDPAALGAVKSPVVEIVPAEALHAIDVRKPPVPWTLAEHWSVCSASADGAAQVTLTEVMAGGVFPGDEPLHPSTGITTQAANKSAVR